METKKIIEKLEIISDINDLSLEDIANKYLSSKENYDDFLQKYSDIFVYGPLYQLRVFPEYKKIMDVINYGNIMYPSKENENLAKKILNFMDYNIDKYKLYKYSDDEIQAKHLLNQSIGLGRIDEEMNYKNVVSMLLSGAQKYEKRDGNSIKDFKDYVPFIRYSYDYPSQERFFKKYFEDHSLMSLCNDPEFLMYANYLINTMSSSVDDAFIEDVESVITASNVMHESKMIRETDRSYKILAKFTTKSIKNYKKEKEKENRHAK